MNRLITHNSFLMKLALLLTILFLSVAYSRAATYTYTLPSGGVTEATVEAGMDAACAAGDCEGGDFGDDTIKIVINDGVSSSVAPVEADWDLTEYSVVIIDILGEDGSGSGGGGSCIKIPLSFAIVVVTRKKMSKRKAMSAIEPELTSGVPLSLFLAIIQLLF